MKISNLSYIEKLFIPPSPGDSGAALGSAYYSFLKSNKKPKPRHNEFLESNLFPGRFFSVKKTSREFLATGMTKICETDEAIDRIADLIKKWRNRSDMLSK